MSIVLHRASVHREAIAPKSLVPSEFALDQRFLSSGSQALWQVLISKNIYITIIKAAKLQL